MFLNAEEHVLVASSPCSRKERGIDRKLAPPPSPPPKGRGVITEIPLWVRGPPPPPPPQRGGE